MFKVLSLNKSEWIISNDAENWDRFCICIFCFQWVGLISSGYKSCLFHKFRTALGQEKLLRNNILFLWDCFFFVTQNLEKFFQMSSFIRSAVFPDFNQM